MKFFFNHLVTTSYLILFVACIIEITQELGFHVFDSFLSHHGLFFVALAHLIKSFEKILGRFK
jgi:hypothetical protein